MADDKGRQELTTDDGKGCKIFLYKTNSEAAQTVTYILEVAKFAKVDFEMSFEGSENINVQGATGLKKSVSVGPFKREPVCTVALGGEWKMQMAYSWQESEPDIQAIQEEVEKEKSIIDNLMTNVETKNLPFGDDSYTCAQYAEMIEKDGSIQSYIDPDFAPCVGSLFRQGADGTIAQGDIEASQRISWRRPKDFFKADEDFDVFVGGIEPNDIRQGQLGDCWFLCALSALAEFPKLVEALFDIPNERAPSTKNGAVVSCTESGVYRLRFCKNGQWTNVTIDDFFPCIPGGGPVYSRSHGNELWVLLLEKAYAKLHKCYSALRLGWAYEAMMDMTGAPTESYRFDDIDVKAQIDSGDMWKKLVKFDQNNYLMTLSTPGEDQLTESNDRPETEGGLVSGHAYTLLSAQETNTGIKLVQVRNPWGCFEWQGAWGDTSPEWTPEMTKYREEVMVKNGAVPQVADANDGIFWMAFDDVLSHFFSLNVCMTDMSWTETRRKSIFTYGADLVDLDGDGDTSESVVTSTIFKLTVKEQTTLHLGVHQEDERCLTAKPYLDVGLTLLKATAEGGGDSEHAYELITSSGCSVERQNQISQDLSPGEYLLVPITSGCKFRSAAASAKQGIERVSVFDEGFTPPSAEEVADDSWHGVRFNDATEAALKVRLARCTT
jgi:calpain-15